MELKKQYIKEAEKLAEVTYDQHYKANKDKFQSQKSISFNRQKRGFNFKRPQQVPSQFKEDAVYGAKDSPQSKKRTIPNIKPITEFATPSQDKRALPKQPSQFLSNFTASLSGAANIKSPTSAGSLLQNNSNHMTMAQRSLFSVNRMNIGGLDVIREKLRFPVLHSGERKEALGNEINSHTSTMAQYKERAKNKKSRNTATNFKNIVNNSLKEDSPQFPTRRIGQESQAIEGVRQNARKNTKTKTKRTSSMDLFRTLHKDEDLSMKFPSLLERYRNVFDFLMRNRNPSIHHEGPSPAEVRESPQKHSKLGTKKGSEDSPGPWGESPSIKGYYSDSSFRPTKKKLTGVRYFSPSF